jgi:NAD(P)-dependent dehydrogenase (short-subunit alcohol dehydrogenase family)
MLLENKYIGITGAGTGIGKATALALAREGAFVAVTDLNPEWAKNVTEEIHRLGGKAIDWPLDVTNPQRINEVVGQMVDRFGRIDVWVNNAGVSTMNRFVDLTEEDWDFNMRVNAKGTFLCSQVVVRQMLKQERDPNSGLRGKIINVASMAGKRGNAPFLAHYVASKFAVVGLTQATAYEFAPHGITVNSVCPGYVQTSMQEREVQWEAQLRGVTPDAVRQLYIADTPLGRLETPEDVARVIVFLASSLADFITGVSISVNGGSYMD